MKVSERSLTIALCGTKSPESMVSERSLTISLICVLVGMPVGLRVGVRWVCGGLEAVSVRRPDETPDEVVRR